MSTYLDYNATAPLRPEAREAMLHAFEQPQNASSVHSYGRSAGKILEEARENIAALIGAPQNQVIFNSGATEGNNTVLKHFEGERILASAIEHPAVLQAAANIEHVAVNASGTLDLQALETALKEEKTGLVSVMLVNNETGIIQPIKEAAALAHKHGALFHCDAVQAPGRLAIDMQELGIDFLTLSSHKIGGPQGVGALALGLCGITPTLLQGGGQEKSARAGTENIAGIAGFGAAAKAASALSSQSHLQTSLEDQLARYEDLVIFGQDVQRVSNTTLFALPGVSSETLLMALDLDGVAVSNGSACSSGRVEPSHVLKAMHVEPDIASGAIRISTGWASTQEDIDRFLEVWDKTYTRLKNKGK